MMSKRSRSIFCLKFLDIVPIIQNYICFYFFQNPKLYCTAKHYSVSHFNAHKRICSLQTIDFFVPLIIIIFIFNFQKTSLTN